MGVKWYGEIRTQEITRELRRRLNECGRECVKYATSHMKPQATAGTGRRRRGLNPSKPGEFPKRVTGHLARHIRFEVATGPRIRLRMRWGTSVPYGRYLDEGTTRMKARPWISLTMRALFNKLTGIMGEGM